MSYRSEDLHFATDRGMPIQDARCEAFRMDTKASVEEAFTDEYGDVAFTQLPAAIDCIIFCYHHGTSSFYYSKKDPPLGDLDGDLDDIDDGTSYGRVALDQLTVNRITLGGADGDLDDIADGTYGKVLTTSISAGKIKLDEVTDGTYGKVLSTHIDAGKIKISSSTTYATNYDPSSKKKVFTSQPTTPYYVGDLWLDASTLKRCTTQRLYPFSYTAGDWTATTLDAIADGTTYERVKSTSISAGNIQLNSYTSISGEWYNESGVEIDATHGINIYGTNNALTTRATKTGTIQCYVGSDGKIYAGAGNVWLDSSGATVKGTSGFIVKDSNGTTRGYIGADSSQTWLYIYSVSGSDLCIEGGGGTGAISLKAANVNALASIKQNGSFINYLDYTLPYTDKGNTLGYDDGTTKRRWADLLATKVSLFEEASSAATKAGYGRLSAKTDGKLYYRNGDGTEYTVDLTAV